MKLTIYHLYACAAHTPFLGLVPANLSGATMQKTSADATWDGKDLASED